MLKNKKRPFYLDYSEGYFWKTIIAWFIIAIGGLGLNLTMLVAGVDEAGRGCVIGPLVVAGVMVKAENLSSLIEIGVKDSKLLTAKKREEFYPEIIRLAEKYQTMKVIRLD